MAPILLLIVGIAAVRFAPQIARNRALTFGKVWSGDQAAERFTVVICRVVGSAFILASCVQLWRNLRD